jgi:hypothetical protein
MRYVFTIWMDEASRESATEEEIQETGAAYGAYTEEVQGKGILVAGEGLQPASTSTTVRVRDGEKSVTDGPFAETKEQLGGFYVLDCKDLDEAIEWAAKIPGAQYGAIEVRPAIEVEQPSEAAAS